MREIHDLRPGEKMLILGQNGSGKSVLAQAITRSWSWGSVVVLDPKGDDPAASLPNAAELRHARDVIAHLPGRVVWRPDLEEKSTYQPGDNRHWRPLWNRLEDVSRKILADVARYRQPTLLVVHELREVCTEHQIGHAFRELITAGRSRGVTLILITQRPQHVALEARDEAQHVAVFSLTGRAAREEAASLLGDPERPDLVEIARRRALPLDHTWWYRGPDHRLRYHTPVRLTGRTG
jgi:DNA helicase HerA-like ATPase